MGLGASSAGPSPSVKMVGVLRLRGCFAKRSSYSAQDDSSTQHQAVDFMGSSCRLIAIDYHGAETNIARGGFKSSRHVT